MSHAVFSAFAEGDLAEIWVSIAINPMETADRFVEELRERAQRIAEQPLMGAERPEFGEELRSFPHGDFLVVYRPTAFGIVIARVVHGARNLRRLVVPWE